MTPKNRPLSNRQRLILDYLVKHFAENAYSPSVRDIQRACSISSTSVVDYNLQRLQIAGYITRVPSISRSITLLGADGESVKKATRNALTGEEQEYLAQACNLPGLRRYSMREAIEEAVGDWLKKRYALAGKSKPVQNGQ